MRTLTYMGEDGRPVNEAPATAGDDWTDEFFLSDVRDGSRGAGTGARDLERQPACLRQSVQSADRHAVRQEYRRRRRIVRADDPQLWKAGFRSSEYCGRWRALHGEGGGHLAAPFLQPPSFRPRRREASRAAAQVADRRANVRPLCDAVARHGGSVPADG